MSLDTVAPPIEPTPVTTDAPVVEPSTPAEADTALQTQSLETFEQKQPRRHRARSQQAGREDVPRIRELTAKLREREAEVEALKKPAAVSAPAPVVSSPARPTSSAPIPPPVVAGDKDPQPSEDRDPSTGKPYESFTKFTSDFARWSAREEMRSARTSWEQQETKATEAAESARLAESWTAGVGAAKQTYPDFEAVAYGPAPWAANSLIDRWIKEHPAGPLVLYSLKKDPTTAHAMLAMSLFEQTEALSLLSQRLRPKGTAAVATGAVPAIETKPVPRPPTPVRTGPMRTEPAAPDPENLSLDAFAEATGAVKRRRA